MDATDAALVDIDGDNIKIIAYKQFPIDSSLKKRLRYTNTEISLYESSKLDVELGEMFAMAANSLLKSCDVSPNKIRAIGSHGQTLLHFPDKAVPRTLQLGDPNIITSRTGITTVSDFRRADMAAGGQGAPLAPIFHNWKFRSYQTERIILNLGGMANITVLPADKKQEVTGFDTGPGNALMDIWIQQHHNKDYDQNGEWALSGKVNQNLLECLLSDEFFSKSPPKSTGKDEFNLIWLNSNIYKSGMEISDEDVQATLLELTAKSITQAIDDYAQSTQEILVCGGGFHNLALMYQLKTRNQHRMVHSTETFGIHPDAVEAVTFAWLAHLRLEGIPGNLPSVTGAEKAVLLGGIYD